MDNTISGQKVERNYKGPASHLAELIDDKGSRNVAIVFFEKYHNHPVLNDSLDTDVLDFLQAPMVSGIAALIDHVPEKGTFIFNTGKCWSLAEVIRGMADRGIRPGPRAGIELLLEVGRVLVEAAIAAEMYAVYSHGGLTPWRIMLRQNAKVQIIGYALPQVEILEYHCDESAVPREDSFRYCPPERIQNDSEDILSDLFGLALIAFEMMVTSPMYDGSLDAIRQKAARGEGSRQLYKYKQEIPKEVRDFLSRALQPSREYRFASGDEFISEAERLLHGGLPGMTLIEVMEKVQESSSSVRKMPPSDNSKTTIFDRDKLLDEMGYDKPEEKPVRQEVTLPPKPKKEKESTEDAKSIVKSTSTGKPLWSGVRRSVDSLPPVTPSKNDADVAVNTKAASNSLVEMLRKSKMDSSTSDLVQPVRRNEASKKAKAITDLFSSASESNDNKEVDEQPVVIEDVVEPVVGESAKPQDELANKRETDIDMDPKTDGSSKSKSLANDILSALPKSSKKKSIEPDSEKQKPKPIEQKPKLDDEPNSEESCDEDDATAVLERPLHQKPQTPNLAIFKSTIEEPEQASSHSLSPLNDTVMRLKTNQFKGEMHPFSIELSNGFGRFKIKLPLSATCSQVIGGLLVGRTLPYRLDLQGRLSSWHRFKGEDGWINGGKTLDTLPKDKPLSFFMVPNTILWALIKVHDVEGIRTLRSQVGSAVPAYSLMDALIVQFGLSSNQWSLWIGDREMDVFDIIADFQHSGDEPLSLTLKRSG